MGKQGAGDERDDVGGILGPDLPGRSSVHEHGILDPVLVLPVREDTVHGPRIDPPGRAENIIAPDLFGE